MRNEDHARQDWRVEQDPAYLLRVDKADHRLDSLGRGEFNDLLNRALDAAAAAERRATVERIRKRLAGMAGGSILLEVPSFSAILDEEAAR